MIHDLAFWDKAFLAALHPGEDAIDAAEQADAADALRWERSHAMPQAPIPLRAEPHAALLDHVRSIENLAWAASSPDLHRLWQGHQIARAIEIVHSERAAKVAA